MARRDENGAFILRTMAPRMPVDHTPEENDVGEEIEDVADYTDDEPVRVRLSDERMETTEERESSIRSGIVVDENDPEPSVAVKAAPVALQSKTRLKITVNRLHATAEWKWAQSGDDSCGICRMPFEACCVDCKVPGDECPLVLGICKHPFHMHCIVKWTESQTLLKPHCPLCRQEWKFT